MTLILHEVLYVIGLRANEKEYEQKNYRRDNAMIKLANELLKASKKPLPSHRQLSLAR